MQDRELPTLIDVELAEAERWFDRTKARFLDGVTDESALQQRRRFLRLFETLLSDMHEARRRIDTRHSPGDRLLRSALRRLAS